MQRLGRGTLRLASDARWIAHAVFTRIVRSAHHLTGNSPVDLDLGQLPTGSVRD